MSSQSIHCDTTSPKITIPFLIDISYVTFSVKSGTLPIIRAVSGMFNTKVFPASNVSKHSKNLAIPLDFGNAKKIRCSLGHWWLVWDFLEKKYVKIQTKELIEAQDRYGIPELEALKRDKKLILECHEQFEKTHTFYGNFGFEIKRL